MSPRIACAFLATVAASAAIASEFNGTFSEPRPAASTLATQRVIVGWRETVAGAAKGTDPAARAAKLSAAAAVQLKYLFGISPQLDTLQLTDPVSAAQLDAVLERLRNDPAVAFAEPDERRHAHRVPNDPLFSSQWTLQGVEISATRSQAAWDVTVGDAAMVVAVLDTGVRYDHPDLATVAQDGKLLQGFDFVSADADGSFLTANDGNGRDADASDPGDWVDANDLNQPAFSGRDCTQAPSSWHGTRVSGLLGARTDNVAGIAGVAWDPFILPVRVLGKCGGNDSDILAAMRWAGGLPLAGVHTNPNPARVINMSLGSDGACRQTYVTVLNELAAAGVMVVVSAGNDGGAVDAPGNCPGVIAVGALRHIGTKVGFSNVGGAVTVSAPGGNCVNVGAGQPCLFSIHTTTDAGNTVPAGPTYTDQFNFNVGTSFSAPLVAGTVALMRTVNPALPLAQITRRLRESARPFPTTSNSPASAQCPLPVPVCRVPVNDADLQTCECICTTATCGAGMLDTAGSVISAQRPLVSIQVPATTAPGQSVDFNATASAAAPGRTLATFAWEVLFSSGSAPVITGAGLANASAPAPASGEYALRLTITDDQGAQDVAYVALRTGSAASTSISVSQDQPAPTPPPPPPAPPPSNPPPSGGGGGGGSLGWELLALWLGVRLARATRR